MLVTYSYATYQQRGSRSWQESIILEHEPTWQDYEDLAIRLRIVMASWADEVAALRRQRYEIDVDAPADVPF